MNEKGSRGRGQRARGAITLFALFASKPPCVVTKVWQRRGFRTPDPGPWTLNPRGFTLLEVLLALAILAAIVTSIYASFSTSAGNRERAEEVRDGTDRARTLLARMASDITNAYVNAGMSETFFYGSKVESEQDKQRFDSIALTTLTNWRKPGSREMELWEVGYFFQEKPDGTGRVLMRKEKRELSKDSPPREGGVDYELTDTVEGLQLRYYDGTQKKWVDEWKRGGRPAAVELVLTLADGRVYATSVDMRQP